MSDSEDRKAHRILGRDWHELRALWIDHIPEMPLAGSAPDTLIGELPDLESILSAIPKDQVNEVFEAIPGLRSSVLHEAIFVLHKAVHVLGASCVHVSQGMCTWSLSSAYQSAFFSMKAVLGMLGIVGFESSSRHFLLDVWGRPKKPRKGIRGPIVVICNTGRIEQRHQWRYLQRALDRAINCEGLYWQALGTLIAEGEHSDFGRQRNDLHYRINTWGADLHACIQHHDFGRILDGGLDIEQPDFSLRLAFGLAGMGRRMLSEIAENSATIRAELALIDEWLAQPFNDLYRQNHDALQPVGH